MLFSFFQLSLMDENEKLWISQFEDDEDLPF